MADSGKISAPFEILFEDQHLIVISKSAGLLSQGDASGDPSLVDLLRVHFGRNYVGLIHRLDRNTSGLMVIAKRSKSADRLSEQLKSGELDRQYHAILWGALDSRTPTHWEHWLLKNESTNEVRVVRPGTPQAKIAGLEVTPLKTIEHPVTGDALTLAHFKLETGRSHQIRVQSHAMKHPLIGDTKYGIARSMTLFSRPALHSAMLSFTHPMTREKMSFSQRYSHDMLDFFSTKLE
jgi:23S rRNA pseudouridine1911/1915/1917 synthase